ncbi:MAG TPA: hypothetical protein VK363_11990 [Pyrinomonadaceae bacterium]|nr:hypothetical protein [Pyrinomonadaceae bacterium]
MSYKRAFLLLFVLLTVITAGYMVAVRPGTAGQKKLTIRKGPRTLPPAVNSLVEGLVITNVRFEYDDEMTVYDIYNNTNQAVLSVVVRAANGSVTTDSDPGTVLIPPGGQHVGRMLTDNIKDDTPLELSAAAFEGEVIKGLPKDVERMKERRQKNRERVQHMKESGDKQ